MSRRCDRRLRAVDLGGALRSSGSWPITELDRGPVPAQRQRPCSDSPMHRHDPAPDRRRRRALRAATGLRGRAGRRAPRRASPWVAGRAAARSDRRARRGSADRTQWSRGDVDDAGSRARRGRSAPATDGDELDRTFADPEARPLGRRSGRPGEAVVVSPGGRRHGLGDEPSSAIAVLFGHGASLLGYSRPRTARGARRGA